MFLQTEPLRLHIGNSVSIQETLRGDKRILIRVRYLDRACLARIVCQHQSDSPILAVKVKHDMRPRTDFELVLGAFIESKLSVSPDRDSRTETLVDIREAFKTEPCIIHLLTGYGHTGSTSRHISYTYRFFALCHNYVRHVAIRPQRAYAPPYGL